MDSFKCANQSFTEEVSLTTNKPTYMVTYFYALLAMTCMYGAFGGIAAIVNTGGNLSVRGPEIWCPARKTTFAYMLSSVTSLFTSIMMVLAYVLLILKIDFGGSWDM